MPVSNTILKIEEDLNGRESFCGEHAVGKDPGSEAHRRRAQIGPRGRVMLTEEAF